MLYNDDPIEDRNNILRHIDDFSKGAGITPVSVNSLEVMDVCLRIRNNFPYAPGIDKASAFKKVANFVAHFLEVSPIKSSSNIPIDGLKSYSLNAVIAFDIAVTCLQNADIKDDGGTVVKTINKPLYISDHSYVDIISALSLDDITQKTHFELLSVFFEQLTYKTNGHCEYKPAQKGNSGDKGYYSGEWEGTEMLGV